ncbi:MAG: S9 family peptidase [Methanomassiliicoccales archaeon]
MNSAGNKQRLLPYERFCQYFRYGAVDVLPNQGLIYTCDMNGQFNLWTQSHKGRLPGYQRMLTAFDDRTVREFALSRDGKTIFFMADREGNEQFQLFSLSVKGGDPEALTNDETVRHELNRGCVHPSGNVLAYADNGRDRKDFDLVIRNLRKGSEERPLEGGYIWSFPIWNETGSLLSVSQLMQNTETHTFIYNPKRKRSFEIMPHTDQSVVDCAGWLDDDRLMIITDLGSEFKRLSIYSIKASKESVLYQGKHDVEGAFYSPQTRKIIYALNVDGYTELFCGKIGGRFGKVKMPHSGHLYSPLAGMSVDQRRNEVAVEWAFDNQPPEIVVIELTGVRGTTMTESLAGGMPLHIESPELIHYTSFDGKSIPAFYYRPKGKGKFPAVLSIHGGPESQERPGWNYFGLYQFLLSRGIALLCPNIRGSTGYGKSYQKLIHRDWGGGELKDLAAAAEWLRSRKEIDGDRLAVFGGSFGGFATLSCVTRLNQYWIAGVDICGPSNLVTFCKSVPPFWLRFMREWVGDPDTEADFLMSRSPIAYAENTKADMLIIQGANDPRVVKAESDQLVEKLRSAGRHVEYMIFPDEGHGFTRTENAKKGYRAAADFLVNKLLS